MVLLSGDEVVRVDTGALGCPKPGRPAVFRDRVYVPCRGSGKVVVLDRSGRRGAEDVRTGGSGDPALVFDDGKLFINTPGANQGVIVDADGRTRSVVIRDPELPVMDPERSPIPSVPSPPPPRPDPPTRENPRGGPNPPAGDNETTTPVAPVTTTSSADVAGVVPGRPSGVTVSQRSNNGTSVVVTVSWRAVPDGGEPISGYTVTATGGFSGGSREVQVAGTSTELTLACAGTFCTSGRLDVAVAAYNRFGAGETGAASWMVRPVAPPPTTTTQAPVPTTTTTTVPPAPPPTTTTTTTVPPPPPPSLPTAGAAVITTFGPTGDMYTKRVNMTPPADWASHDGPCELINLTFGHSEPIACSATSAMIGVDVGSNRIVVRAHAATGTGSVDSAVRSTPVRDIDECGGRICQPRSVPAAAEGNQLVGGGIGLLATAWLLTLRNRRERRGESE